MQHTQLHPSRPGVYICVHMGVPAPTCTQIEMHVRTHTHTHTPPQVVAITTAFPPPFFVSLLAPAGPWESCASTFWMECIPRLSPCSEHLE